MRPLALTLGLATALCMHTSPGEARERARRSAVTLSYRHASFALPSAEGDYHGASLAFSPLRALGASRWLRWELGAEVGARSGPNNHTDVFVFALSRLGWQHPFGRVTPFVVAVGALGLGTLERVGRTDGRILWSAGGELGADLRVAGPVGLTAAFGYGRTVEGDIHHDGPWVRVGFAIFP